MHDEPATPPPPSDDLDAIREEHVALYRLWVHAEMAGDEVHAAVLRMRLAALEMQRLRLTRNQ